MIDLCIDARMAFSSGIGTYIREIVPHFRNSSFRPILLVDRLNESWCRDFEQILFASPIYSIQEQIHFPLKIPRCDLFFSPHYNIPLAPIKAKKRIVMIHDVFHLVFSSTLRWHERIYANYVLPQAVSRSDLVITNSQFSSREICKYTKASETKIRPIHCAVNQDVFKREKNLEKIEKIRAKYSLPASYFLFVGNLKQHKNLKRVLLSLRELPSSARLVIVGKSEGMNHIDRGDSIFKQFPEIEERVLCFSSVTNEELPIFYQLAEALVFPSYYEGFGLPPLEAMSCGCPVIVSNRASLPEVCGQAAIYVCPDDTVGLATAMKRVIGDPEYKDKMILKGYQNIERFSWKISAERHVQLFQSL